MNKETAQVEEMTENDERRQILRDRRRNVICQIEMASELPEMTQEQISFEKGLKLGVKFVLTRREVFHTSNTMPPQNLTDQFEQYKDDGRHVVTTIQPRTIDTALTKDQRRRKDKNIMMWQQEVVRFTTMLPTKSLIMRLEEELKEIKAQEKILSGCG